MYFSENRGSLRITFFILEGRPRTQSAVRIWRSAHDGYPLLEGSCWPHSLADWCRDDNTCCHIVLTWTFSSGHPRLIHEEQLDMAKKTGLSCTVHGTHPPTACCWPHFTQLQWARVSSAHTPLGLQRVVYRALCELTFISYLFPQNLRHLLLHTPCPYPSLLREYCCNCTNSPPPPPPLCSFTPWPQLLLPP